MILLTFCAIIAQKKKGEPLIHPHFFEIYKYLDEKGFQVSVVTNGVLVDDEIVKLFKKYPPFYLAISLYGYDKKSYFNTTGQDKFDDVLRNIDRLKKAEVEFYIKYVALTTNSDFQKINHIFLSKDIDFFIYPIILPTRKGDIGNQYLQLKGDKFKKMMYYSEEMAKKSKYKPPSSIMSDYSQCNVWKKSFVVSPDGNVRPCVPYDVFENNILYKSIEDVIGTLRKVHEESYRYPLKCKGCLLKSYCCCPIQINLYGDTALPCEKAKVRKEFYDTKKYI